MLRYGLGKPFSGDMGELTDIYQTSVTRKASPIFGASKKRDASCDVFCSFAASFTRQRTILLARRNAASATQCAMRRIFVTVS